MWVHRKRIVAALGLVVVVLLTSTRCLQRLIRCRLSESRGWRFRLSAGLTVFRLLRVSVDIHRRWIETSGENTSYTS